MAEARAEAAVLADPLVVDRVEVEDPGDGRLLVRVTGQRARPDPAGGEDAVLVVLRGGRRLRFPPLQPPPHNALDGSFALEFSLPDALWPSLASALTLELGAQSAVLPAPQPREAADGWVVDLAERPPTEDDVLSAAEQGLAQARDTIARARLRLDELELEGEDLRERVAVADAIRASVEAELQDARAATATAEAAVRALEDELEQRALLQYRAQTLIDELHSEVAELREQAAEQVSARAALHAALARFLTGAHGALADAERQLDEARSAGARAEHELARERERSSALEAGLAQVRAQQESLADDLVDAAARAEHEHAARSELATALDQERGWRQELERQLRVQEAEASRAQEEAAQESERRLDLEARLSARVAEQRAFTSRLRAAVDAERAEWQQRVADATGEHERLSARADELARALEVERAARAEAEALAARVREECRRLEQQLHSSAAAPNAAHWPAVASPVPAAPSSPVGDGSGRWLEQVLPALARDDPDSAARLALELLPAQRLTCARPLDYDLHLRHWGIHAVSLGRSDAAVRRLDLPRVDREVDLRLRADLPGLLELLIAGGSRRLRRERAVRVEATLRPLRRLRALRPVPLELDRLAAAGVLLDPCLCFRALSYLVESAWTAGEDFSVCFEPTDARDRPWYVVVTDGAPLAVTRRRPSGGPQATVVVEPAAFQSWLAAGAGRFGASEVSGDERVVGLLAAWTQGAIVGGVRNAL